MGQFFYLLYLLIISNITSAGAVDREFVYIVEPGAAFGPLWEALGLPVVVLWPPRAFPPTPGSPFGLPELPPDPPKAVPGLPRTSQGLALPPEPAGDSLGGHFPGKCVKIIGNISNK